MTGCFRNPFNRYVNEFCNFMASLANCLVISAGIERMFSTYGIIWYKLRNSLGIKKVKKKKKTCYNLQKTQETDPEVHQIQTKCTIFHQFLF